MDDRPKSTWRLLAAAFGTQGAIALAATAAGGFAASAFGPAALLPAIVLGVAIPGGAILYSHARRLSETEARLRPKTIAAVTPSFSSTWAEAETKLADARRKVGRKSAMWRPLDKLVRAVRILEKRLIDEPETRKLLARSLRRRVPLIAETAERYADLSTYVIGEDSKLRAAEGLLRRSADTLTRLSKSNATDRDFLRLDVDAEVLGDHMKADAETLTANAAALHGAHHLRVLSEEADAEMAAVFDAAAARLESIAGHVDRGARIAQAAAPFLEDELPPLLEAADLYIDVLMLTGDSAHDGLASGREKLRVSLARLADVEQACIDSAVGAFDAQAAQLPDGESA